MDIMDVIRDRRTVGKAPGDVSRATVLEPIEAATWAAAAVQNLLLAAHAKGLSAAWKTGLIVYDDAVKAFLGLRRADRIVAIVYLGATALEAPAPRERDMHARVHWLADSRALA